MLEEYLIAAVAVLTTSALAFTALRSRNAERARRVEAEGEAGRAGFLAGASDLLDLEGPLEDLQRLTSLAIPERADLCTLDLVEPDGRLGIGAVSATRPASAEDLLAARRAAPLDPDGAHPVARVARGEGALLLPAMTDADLGRYAADPDHRALIQRLRFRSAIVVPLTARGRRLGVLSLLRLGTPNAYDDQDLAGAQEFARRAGLAIDHARLFGRLAETQTELQTVMQVLAEAVMVFDSDEQIVWANQAAAELHGVRDAQELVEVGMGGMADLWEVRGADGEPVDSRTLPGRRVLAGETPEPTLLRVINRRTGERRWRLVKASPILDDAGRPRLVVSVTEDVTAAQRQEFAQRFLAEASRLLSSSLDLERTLEQVASASVPALADWCAVDMPDERGRLVRVATADAAPERRLKSALVVQERSADTALDIGPPQVMRTGRSELYAEIDEAVLRRAARDDAQFAELAAVGARSVLIVGIWAADRVIGTITLGTAESGRRLDADDLALAEELGRRAGIAVEHARVHAERSRIAATLQDALLPPRLPAIPGMVVASRFRAAGEASEVGGDFYDLFPVGEDWMAIMGDVSGKGPDAAAITSLARYTMRTAAAYESQPSGVLRRLNEALSHDDDDGAVCTAVCVRIRPGGNGEGATVKISRAGHPPPLLACLGEPIRAVGAPGSLLGAFAEGSWSDDELELRPGEAIVLYTDGVTDTRGADERFGSKRLEQTLRDLAGRSADDLADGLDAALLDFQVGEQRDDVALLVLEAQRT